MGRAQAKGGRGRETVGVAGPIQPLHPATKDAEAAETAETSLSAQWALAWAGGT